MREQKKYMYFNLSIHLYDGSAMSHDLTPDSQICLVENRCWNFFVTAPCCCPHAFSTFQ